LGDKYGKAYHTPLDSAFCWEMSNPSAEAQTDTADRKFSDDQTNKKSKNSAKKESAIQNSKHQEEKKFITQYIIKAKKDSDNGNENSEGEARSDIKVKKKTSS
jgi:hypothetical protein